MALVRGGVWGGPPQIIVINFLSSPNTPFLLPIPIIDYAIIITNCCTTASKLCLIFVTNIFFSQFCVVCLKSPTTNGRWCRWCRWWLQWDPHCTTDVRKYFFSERVIDRWNMLTEDCVSSCTINEFKGKLTKIRNNKITADSSSSMVTSDQCSTRPLVWPHQVSYQTV